MNLAATILVVAPHPDDEILGCSWLMRRVVAVGGRVVVVWMTDGSASHGDLDAVARGALVARRQREAQDGLAALGIVPLATYFLGQRDGQLATAAEPARAALAAICVEHAVETVFVTSAADGHPDHRASFRIASGLHGIRLYAYPVSGRYDGAEVEIAADAIRIDEPAARTAKRAALACHGSQIQAGGARYPMSAAVIDRFCSEAELFLPIGDRA